MKRTLPGFTLIELMIVVVILGILYSFRMNIAGNMRDNSARSITKERRAAIVKVLAGYVARENCLPTPYIPNQTVENSANKFITGIVPYKTLLIDESLVKDGYGNYFTYAVAPDLTNKSFKVHNLKDFCAESKSPIQIKNIDGTVKAEPENMIAIVLISHGPKGRGAYLPSGSKRPTVGEFEQVNAAETATFYQGKRSSNFQHNVWWASRNNFVSVYIGKHCKKYEADHKPKTNQCSEENDDLDDLYADTDL